MKFRFLSLLVFSVLVLGLVPSVFAQQPAGTSELSINQRLQVMNDKLETMRRLLTNAISSMAPAKTNDKAKANDKDKAKQANANLDDPVVRLKNLEKEATSLLSEVNDIRTKNDK